ncbi:uncharacterized protein LOC114750129 [Neltuma alba]|uniref:uncharacterized protein LOC114723569 n=1 Tax=Neltuma alba TaxID=207710 RepID=UPI0010A3CB98|nr:uncharacterized protein LOC114723569 [Prosopis alba]XP_028794501.1 uncharacterized protein LOC114750129 [Prosopis alba]
MSKPTTTAVNARAVLWRARVISALRTTLACTIVGCTSLYGPAPLRRYLKFPAFSYVTTILIVSDATLGDALRGCWHVFCASLQAMILSIAGLQLIGPANLTVPAAAGAVAVGALVVAMPESSHLMSKRIAFGQLVIVYVKTVIDGADAGVMAHPIHVASSTALGALASVLAMLFPYPHLACLQIRNVYKLYVAHASERLNHNLQALSALDNASALDWFTEAKSLSTVGSKLLDCIRCKLDGMRWERPQVTISDPNYYAHPEEHLQDMELTLRGMEIALSYCSAFPVEAVDQELRGVLLDYKGRITQKLDQQAKCFALSDTATVPDSKKEISNSFSGSPKSLCKACKDLPTSFFIYCAELLLKDSHITNNEQPMAEKTDAVQYNSWKIREFAMNLLPKSQNLAFAIKCSLSLGIAVLLGLIYNKENGYWSGLTIAISFITERQATFTAANARGQGTAMGSVYGILCCFLFERSVDLRLLPILPWVVFSCFLMHGRMYGQAGGISAVLGALLILGRKHYGTPTQFAIARITEATIGLICYMIVEILMNPSRAATLAKSELSQCLRSLQDCIDAITISPEGENQMPRSPSQTFRERRKKLKCFVNQLEQFSSDAKSEPSFWFLPFHGACYSKMLESLSRMVDLLHFVEYSTEHVPRFSEEGEVNLWELQEHMVKNIELFQTKVAPTLRLLEEITRMKSLSQLEQDLKSENIPGDVESGHANGDTSKISCASEDADRMTGSFLQHLEEAANMIETNKDEEILIGQMIFHYSCLGFCIVSLMREAIKIENEVKQLLVWENPSSRINLNEIYCKINALRSE